MKIALLGKGKTGKIVPEIAENAEVIIFDSKNKPTLKELSKCDVAISFVHGPVFLQYVDLLIESNLPVVNGSTGFNWPENIDEKLKQHSLAWITASNFALGMNLVHAMIKTLSKAPKLFVNYEYQINEIHHSHKKDIPSGTALAWQKWLGHQAPISAERDDKVDNPGFHKLKLITPYENITIEHQSKDRKIFAEGAVWTANRLLKGDIKPGLHNLSDIMKNELDL